MATFTPLVEDDFRALLTLYEAGEFIAFSAIPAGSVNSNFAVEAGGVRYFFRVYEEQEQSGAAAETRMLAALADRGVRTPKPVKRRDGEWLSRVRGKPAALFPWEQGTMRCQAGVTPRDAERVGMALAQVHVAGADVERPQGRFREADLFARLDRIERAPDATLASQAAPLRSALSRWSRARNPDLPRGLIHGDLFRDNVLWRENGEIAALLDFESASDGVLAYDVMVTILAWCVGDDLDLDLARAMVKGYESVRRLTRAEKEALVTEGCLAALRFSITRITDYAMRAGTGPRVMKDYRRFVMRLAILEKYAQNEGSDEFCRALGL